MRPRGGSATTTRTRSSTTSRLTFVELHDEDKATTVAGFMERACLLGAQGVRSKRQLTDNAVGYVRSRSLRALLARPGSCT